MWVGCTGWVGCSWRWYRLWLVWGDAGQFSWTGASIVPFSLYESPVLSLCSFLRTDILICLPCLWLCRWWNLWQRW
jgi:hypothetical protein